MNTLVMCGAWTTDRSRWAALRESAERFQVNLHDLAQGNPHFPDMETFPRNIEFLEQREEKYVVVTDAYDTLVNRWDERELARLIDSAPHCIMSVEEKCWPHDGPYEDGYSHIGDHPWKFICGGQYCGRRADIIELFRELYRRWQRGDSTRGGSSQEILHQIYAERFFPLSLDLECRIFQSMLGKNRDLIRNEKGIGFNAHTASFPMFLHWNGQGPGIPAGLTDWLQR